MTTPRQQSWHDGAPPGGRLVVVSDNPVSAALVALAATVGRDVVLVADDEDGAAVRALGALDLQEGDAVALCDHDAPDAPRLLREALASPVGYVAMLSSRRRAASVLEELEQEAVEGLHRLQVPAGLDLGGRTPGEMALSVMAQVVAHAHGRAGGPLREG